MAYQMPHTTADGVEHPLSYWRPSGVNFNPEDKSVFISFNGYHNEEAAKPSNPATPRKHPIASKTYVVHEDIYNELFAPSEIDQEGNNHIKAAYELALTVLDTDGVSFFDGAEVV